jgi:hypothetical protein
MLVMGVTEGAAGDTEIAAPLVRVDPGASAALAFSGDRPPMGGHTGDAVVPCAVAHWRSNVMGLR